MTANAAARPSKSGPGVTRPSNLPLSEAEFERLMERIGPFEAEPEIAVAVSGGADSLALALLGADWARARGGSVVGLIVDHGLRPESQTEARQVADVLHQNGIGSRVVTWTGEKPRTGIQAAARDARYRLLADACHEDGILHLLTGHHAGDQAETMLLRAGMESGFRGLAGMSLIQSVSGFGTSGVGPSWPRLLRPLLSVEPQRLRATLQDRGQNWIEDPSNKDRRFARVRMREALAGDIKTQVETAGRIGAIRAKEEATVARFLARYAQIYPAGYLVVEAAAFGDAPMELRSAGLARVLACIGGRPYGARGPGLANLTASMAGGLTRVHTLGGCLVAPISEQQILICRESRNIERVPIGRSDDAELVADWDGRFRVRLFGANSGTLGPLGAKDGRKLGPGRFAIPEVARRSLPALRDENGLYAVPHLGYWREKDFQGTVQMDFLPRYPLVPAYFAVALAPSDPI